MLRRACHRYCGELDQIQTKIFPSQRLHRSHNSSKEGQRKRFINTNTNNNRKPRVYSSLSLAPTSSSSRVIFRLKSSSISSTNDLLREDVKDIPDAYQGQDVIELDESHLARTVKTLNSPNGKQDEMGLPYSEFETSHTRPHTANIEASRVSNSDMMDSFTMYDILNLKTFSSLEIHEITQSILKHKNPQNNNYVGSSSDTPDESQIIDHDSVHQFLLERFEDYEKKIQEHSSIRTTNLDNTNESSLSKNFLMNQYAYEQTSLLLNVFRPVAIPPKVDGDDIRPPQFLQIEASKFESHLLDLASNINQRERNLLLPLTLSMLLVGSSVGVINPVMPFVVKSMGLTTGQYGMVVSSFAFAKMVGNVPSAILVERHGRKPYLVHSLSLVGIAVGGISLAQNLEHLMACRLITGLGVAGLSTAATLTIADISTPRNRAATMAPMMSGFAAGMCIGPAIGGELADMVGVNATFGIVGLSYLTIAGINNFLLSETKRDERKGGIPNFFVENDMPWRNASERKSILKDLAVKKPLGVLASVRDAFSQQADLLKDSKIRNVVIMNGFYWMALSGSQMTLLPLMLTSGNHGVAMCASDVGKVYMGMSLVQVLANPIVGMLVDRIGKKRAIIGGTGLLSATMVALPSVLDLTSDLSNDYGYYGLAATMGLWSLGGTMLSTAPVAYVSDVVADKRRAQAIALLRTVGDVGFFAGATSTGALADFSGSLDMAMHSSAGLLFAATTWFGVRQFYLNDKIKKIKA